MTLNPRTKGAEGERQVVKLLTEIIVRVMGEEGYPENDIEAARKSVQRNQNQSAVGGNDLTNTFGMSIEVKRQEQLAVNQWWKQCETAALRNHELPVLIYRQNRKAWHVRTYAWLPLPGAEMWAQAKAVVEFDEATFKSWFEQWVRGKLKAGYQVRS